MGRLWSLHEYVIAFAVVGSASYLSGAEPGSWWIATAAVFGALLVYPMAALGFLLKQTDDVREIFGESMNPNLLRDLIVKTRIILYGSLAGVVASLALSYTGSKLLASMVLGDLAGVLVVFTLFSEFMIVTFTLFMEALLGD